MKKFTVSPNFRKQAHQFLINSNKLKNVFYNTGNTFIVNDKDLAGCKEILDRNMIKLTVVS